MAKYTYLPTYLPVGEVAVPEHPASDFTFFSLTKIRINAYTNIKSKFENSDLTFYR